MNTRTFWSGRAERPLYTEQILLIILCFCIGISPALSQDIRVKGKIIDNNGREMEGVKVVVNDPVRERVVVTVSGETGFFFLNSLKAGKYNISFSLPGFEDKEEKDIEIIAGNENSILVRMQKKRKEKKKLKNETQL